jgi:hypothetical protein
LTEVLRLNGAEVIQMRRPPWLAMRQLERPGIGSLHLTVIHSLAIGARTGDYSLLAQRRAEFCWFAIVIAYP